METKDTREPGGAVSAIRAERERRDSEREARSRQLDRIGLEVFRHHQEALEEGEWVVVDWGRGASIRLSLDSSAHAVQARPVLRVFQGVDDETPEMVAYSYATTFEELGRDLLEFREDYLW